MSTRAWTTFAAVSILWGVPYFFIKVALDDGVPPVFLAWARVLIGALVLLAISRRAGVLGQALGRRRLRWLAAYALVEIVVPFSLISAGEQHIDSSLAAIFIATVPIFIALLAIRFDQAERVTGRRAVGLVTGFAGVVALVGLDVSGSTAGLLGALAILVAAVGYAAGPMILNRHLADIDPRGLMAVALAMSSVALTIPALAKPPTAMPGPDALASIAVLGLFCTAMAFVLFAILITEVGPARASVITYVAPMVAVALGVVVLGERPGPGAIAGVLLILAGSWLSTAASDPDARSRASTPAGGSGTVPVD